MIELDIRAQSWSVHIRLRRARRETVDWNIRKKQRIEDRKKYVEGLKRDKDRHGLLRFHLPSCFAAIRNAMEAQISVSDDRQLIGRKYDPETMTANIEVTRYPRVALKVEIGGDGRSVYAVIACSTVGLDATNTTRTTTARYAISASEEGAISYHRLNDVGEVGAPMLLFALTEEILTPLADCIASMDDPGDDADSAT